MLCVVGESSAVVSRRSDEEGRECAQVTFNESFGRDFAAIVVLDNSAAKA